MQQANPVRTPLTVVGIVSNVMALMLVWVLLSADAQSSKTLLEKLTASIKRMAAVDQVLREDIVKEFGKPQHEWPTEGNWIGRWCLSPEDIMNTSYLSYQISIYSTPHQKPDGKYVYRIDIQVVQEWRSGVKFLQMNLIRGLSTGSLFPLRPYLETEGVRLELALPNGKRVP
jgi:hypothetical protein